MQPPDETNMIKVKTNPVAYRPLSFPNYSLERRVSDISETSQGSLDRYTNISSQAYMDHNFVASNIILTNPEITQSNYPIVTVRKYQQGELSSNSSQNTQKQRIINSNINGCIPEEEYDPVEKFLAEPDSSYVNLKGVNVHYRISKKIGNEKQSDFVNSTLPIILLHGFAGGVFSWRRVFHHLSKISPVVMAFDRPGFGLTSKPLQWDSELNPYSTEFSVELTFALMDYLEIDNAILIGHSTGASLACSCALYNPSKVSGLVLVAQNSGLPNFVRSILKTKLGGPIIMRLVRSEIGDVAIRRA